MNGLVIAVRCHFCSKQRPLHRVHQLTDAQTICDYCVEWHQNAIEVLAGGVPRGCQACERSWQTISDSTPDASVRMYVVPRDGIYQVICRPCVGQYARARMDLYGGTAYGNQLNQ